MSRAYIGHTWNTTMTCAIQNYILIGLLNCTKHMLCYQLVKGIAALPRYISATLGRDYLIVTYLYDKVSV
jgi:hypothetical protein